VQVLAVPVLLEHVEEERLAFANPAAKVVATDVGKTIALIGFACDLAINFKPRLLVAALD
jgi:hypothetical protein